MNNFVGMAEIECICYNENNFCDFGLIRASQKVAGRVKFSSLAILHNNIEISRIIIDLIDFNDVRMLQL